MISKFVVRVLRMEDDYVVTSEIVYGRINAERRSREILARLDKYEFYTEIGIIG